jgi:hypothetical protein
MKKHSIFWPLTLIAIGVLWLLVNTGVIPVENLWALVHYWPILLIALGVGLILRRRWPAAGMVITALVVIGAVLVVIYAPQLGWSEIHALNIQFDLPSGIRGGVKGSGNLTSDSRQVNNFNAIRIDYPADITIQQGTLETVTIEADDNLLPQLETRISGNILIIANREPLWNNRVNPSRIVKINITVKELRSLEFPTAGKVQVENLNTSSLDISLSGAGYVNLTGITLDTLVCRLSGAGNISADGSTSILDVKISGMGNFSGGDLTSQIATVDISGAGNATVWATSALNATISGAGSVNYYGNPPTINEQISGIGNVKDMGVK